MISFVLSEENLQTIVFKLGSSQLWCNVFKDISIPLLPVLLVFLFYEGRGHKTSM